MLNVFKVNSKDNRRTTVHGGDVLTVNFEHTLAVNPMPL